MLAIIPCFNEEQSIEATISEIRNHLPGAYIWVVNNSSTDRTWAVAERCGALVINEPQKGKGFAVRNAFSKIPAQIDAIFMVDGDDTYEISRVQEACNQIALGYDMVVGTRIPVAEESDSRLPAFRRGHTYGNQILSRINLILFGIDIPDTLSGWRVMSPGFVRSFAGGASSFEIEAELNAHAFLISAAVASIDIGYRGRQHGSNSKLNTYADGLRILRRQMFLFRSERPIIAYTLLSIPWIVLSATLVRNVLTKYFETHLIPNFPSLIAGVGCFMVGSLLWATGMILENVRIGRQTFARSRYANS